jgi:hypothetical protein
MIRMEVSYVGPIDPSVVSALENDAIERECSLLMHQQKNRAYPYGVTSSLVREIAEHPHEVVTVDILQSAPEKGPPFTLTVIVKDFVGGRRSEVKGYMDALGDRLYEDLIRHFGETEVRIERTAIPKPIGW